MLRGLGAPKRPTECGGKEPRPMAQSIVTMAREPLHPHERFAAKDPGNRVGRKLLCRGGMARKPICPTPPLPLLGRRAGRGVWAGAALPAVPGGGGGSDPPPPAQNDPHVALIILTTHMRGKFFFVKKNFPGQNLCSGAFGGNIRPYTKQRARHGSPFLEPPPPPPSPGAHTIPPPPQSNFRAAQAAPWGLGLGDFALWELSAHGEKFGVSVVVRSVIHLFGGCVSVSSEWGIAKSCYHAQATMLICQVVKGSKANANTKTAHKSI